MVMIEPELVQTWWFKILEGLLAFMVLWLIYLLRLRQMTMRLRARLEERYGERERIARELHDTLLQSVQGLMLRFQAVADQIAEPQARLMINQVLDRAEAVLVEGRDRVRDLRQLSHPIDDLGQALAAVGRELAEIHTAGFDLEQGRRVRPLNPLGADEIYQIGREAVLNAFQHAAAKRITVELRYDCDELVMRVSDDGQGIDAAILRAAGRPGHWGLAGMHERAGRLDARFEILNEPGHGTEVLLRVPARMAYCDRGPESWLKRFADKALAQDVIP